MSTLHKSSDYNANTNTIEQLQILDVPENKQIRADKEKIINNQKFIHILFDDFIVAFEDDVFTHEWQLEAAGIKEKLEKVCKFACDLVSGTVFGGKEIDEGRK